ncbi:MAG TPA: hypothetical protein PLT76_00130 [Candidatus Omnitrophota bacterium]|nr:hypothetical protein [Candidatus Omnitrophota bacterium]HQO57117.1 hypothetical protein [Candidatus Omnitrophota bacterium]HQP11470.1 hypothetical protein [Candidatus Omnitrophota bacterium]
MNNSGKTLTVFLMIIAVLLVCFTGISVFFFIKEIDLRKSAEYNLEQLRVAEASLRADMKEAEKQIKLLEEKNKEANGRIEDLIEEKSLEQELKEEVKREARILKDELEKESKAKEDIRQELGTQLEAAQERVAAMEQELSVTQTKNKELETIRQDLESQVSDLKKQIDVLAQQLTVSGNGDVLDDGAAVQPGVDLEPIVINTGEDNRGTVISVDKEADFIIVSLGEKDGIKIGMVLSVYRNDKYLGDVEVSRVLPEMSAADVVPPLRSEKVRKDDSVVVKE